MKIKLENKGKDITGSVSDGYHTFDELYEHRNWLWIKLCESMNSADCLAWRSKRHSDGSEIKDWFLLGWRLVHGKQMTYHLPISMWDAAHFAHACDQAPEWDGHSSADVVGRLKLLNVV